MDSGTLLLGVDVGTYETKAVLVDDKGRALASARSVHRVEVPSPGFAEHDAEKSWWAGLVSTVSEVLERWGGPAWRIAAISCSGIGPCVLPVDARLRPLGPAVLYGIDTRATIEMASLTRRLGPERLLEKSGRLMSSQSAGPKILWLKKHDPALSASAAYFLTSHSYLVARMTGEVVVDHATASYFDPLYDQVAGKWDISGCEDFVRAEQLPRLCWPSDVAGPLAPEPARELGLLEGIPVMVGTADAVAEGVACGAVEAGDMMVMYGSSSFMIGVTDGPCFGSELWNAPYAFAGSASLTAGTATAGTATRWICDLLGLGDRNVPGSEFEELMEIAARSSVGANGVMVLPHLSGERTPVHDPSARAAIVGLSLRTGRADVARALLEGIAHSMAGALAAYPRAGFVPKRLLATGGGTNNRVWAQSVSDISGYTQQIVDGAGAAQGSAAIAAIGVGALDAGSCGSWAHLGAVITPDPRAHEILAVAQDDYWHLYAALRQARRPALKEDKGL